MYLALKWHGSKRLIVSKKNKNVDVPLESPVVLIVVELGVGSNNEVAPTAMLVLVQQRRTI